MSKFKDSKCLGEISLRLQAPMIVLEKVAQIRYLPQVFAEAALSELKTAQELIQKLENKK